MMTYYYICRHHFVYRHKISKCPYMDMIYQSFLKGFFFNYIPKKNINFFFIK